MPALWNTHAWDAMFRLPEAMPVLEKVLRPIVVYVFLVILLRVFGKRQLAQLNPFDLVVLLSLANTVQNAIIGEDSSLLGGMIGAVSLCVVNYCVIRFLFRHRSLDQILEGTPTVLIDEGKLVPRGLARELLTESELLSVAHRQGFASLDEIESCVLEPGGTFFIQGKKPRLGERHHGELLAHLEALSRQVEEIRALIGRGDKLRAEPFPPS